MDKNLITDENWKLLYRSYGNQAERSKFWLNISRYCQFGVLAISLLITFRDDFEITLTLIASIIAIFSFVAIIRSDYLKQESQNIQRKFEFYDGLGWDISPEEKSDLYLLLSNKITNSIQNEDAEPYFASTKPQSHRRLLENLIESVWWSNRLANRSAFYLSLFTGGVIILSIIALIVALQNVRNQFVAQAVSQIVVTTLLFVFSAGYARTTLGFVRLHNKSQKIQTKATRMIKSANVLDHNVIILLHEYQILRATSADLPSFVWKQMQTRLNKIWKKTMSDYNY